MSTIPYVTVEKFSELSGYTAKAINGKIDEGVWVEGRQWRKAPDGRRLISIEGVTLWVEGQQEPSKSVKAA